MKRALLTGLLLALAAAPGAEAQNRRRGGGGTGSAEGYEPNVPYDGRFTFVRIRFTPPSGGMGFRGRDIKWDHDYNRAERHFTKILDELSTINPRMDASNILAFDDPELFKYPVAYVSEPGYWVPSEKEADGARKYLQKGGFIIFDDFAGNDIFNLENQLRRVLPEARIMPIGLEHPIWDSFYRISSLDYNHPYYGVKSMFLGIFENNDPTKRLMAVLNYNNDIGEYWEWSDTGAFAIDLSNEAYKIGVNYMIYALTR